METVGKTAEEEAIKGLVGKITWLSKLQKVKKNRRKREGKMCEKEKEKKGGKEKEEKG